MRCYVEWARQQRSLATGGPAQQCPSNAAATPAAHAAQPDTFYRDPLCQQMFRVFVATLVQRVNNLTRVMYR